MAEKTIAVKLNPQLEKEGRGLCDPEDPRNGEVITPLNYGARGYLRVHPSGFIQAQIQAGVLIKVPEKRPANAAGDSAGSKQARSSGSGQAHSGRKPSGDRS